MISHSHPVQTGHGVFNRFEANCPACDEMKARRDIMHSAFLVADATNRAWGRTGDKSISTRAKAGKLQVVRVVFNAKGKSTVTEVSGWLSAAEVVSYLNGMGQ